VNSEQGRVKREERERKKKFLIHLISKKKKRIERIQDTENGEQRMENERKTEL